LTLQVKQNSCRITSFKIKIGGLSVCDTGKKQQAVHNPLLKEGPPRHRRGGGGPQRAFLLLDESFRAQARI
jgi:hypothetical protein